jgi:hypothetical protein
MSNVQEADKIAQLLAELDKTPGVTIREGATPQAPTGTRPLSKATLDDLRSLSEPDANEKPKIKVKLWVDFASE